MKLGSTLFSNMPDRGMKTSVDQIEEAAKRVGMTPRELCIAAGLDQGTWHRWKKAAHSPREDKVLQVLHMAERLEQTGGQKPQPLGSELPFTVGLAQTRPTLGNVEANLRNFREAVDNAKSSGCDIVVFPELSVTGYTLRDMVPVVAMHAEHEMLAEITALSEDIAIVFGYVEESREHHFYNSARYIDGGAIVHNHRKVYLPTYGMFDEMRYFARGDQIRAFDTRLGRMGMLICEDAWHLSAGVILSMDGADIIFNLSNSPARGVSTADRVDTARAWENLNRTYATYFGSYLVFCNRAGTEDGVTFWGGSEVIDPEGNVVAKAQYFDEDFITASLDPDAVRRARMYTPIAREENMAVTMHELARIEQEREDRVR